MCYKFLLKLLYLLSKLVTDVGTDNKITQNLIKKILVGVDGSEKSFEAAEYALNLAEKYKSKLILIVYVLEIEPWLHGEYPYSWGKPEVIEKVYENQKRDIQKILDKIKEKTDKLDLNSKTDMIMTPRTTNPSIALVDYSEKNDIDLIVVGTRGSTGFKKLLLGSVASGVVTYAHCPVLIIK